MQLDLETPITKNFIQNVNPGAIKINNIVYTNNLLVSAEYLETWNLKSIEGIGEHDLELMLQHKPELIVIGTGKLPVFLSPRLLLKVQQCGIGIETMTTAAACRTFNVLLNEGRQVLAGLMVTA